MINPASYIKAKAHQYRKHLIISGLLYGVVWSIILFFTWHEGPELFTWLDLISGIILVFIAYKISKDSYHFINGNILLRILELACLVYAIIWTFIIILIFELDIGELLLPIDAISLYALILILMKIWKSDATPI